MDTLCYFIVRNKQKSSVARERERGKVRERARIENLTILSLSCY